MPEVPAAPEGAAPLTRDAPPWVDAAWLAAVPRTVERCARQWRLTIGERLGTGNTSRVFECVDDRGRALVLKLAPAEMRPDLEAAALTAWAGNGAPELVATDGASGALLLSRLLPGTPLPPGDDDKAVELISPTLVALHSVALTSAHKFPSQLDFLDTWRGWVLRSAEPETEGLRLLDQALSVARAMCVEPAPHVLLHGDFIDKNLLVDRGSYLAVDPIPRVGDPASDVGFFSAYHPPARNIERRARALADRCGIDGIRAARWAAVWAVGEATETWRKDSGELQAWVSGREAAALLAGG